MDRFTATWKTARFKNRIRGFAPSPASYGFGLCSGMGAECSGFFGTTGLNMTGGDFQSNGTGGKAGLH